MPTSCKSYTDMIPSVTSLVCLQEQPVLALESGGAAQVMLSSGPQYGMSCSCPSWRVGMSFDGAIRLFLESFRLPGEAQKINRIVESFGSCYHRQCPNLFKNADAVYIFAYSVILLNTDRHNAQVTVPPVPACLHDQAILPAAAWSSFTP